MNVLGIIKDAFLFPSKNTGRYAIYLLLSVLMAGFIIGGSLTNVFGIFNSENFLLGGMYYIIAMLIIFIMAGYSVKLIKSGIEKDDEVPVFALFEDFMAGFELIVVAIVYYIIPTLIVLVVGFDTNLFSKAIAVCHEVVVQVFNVFIMGTPADVAVTAIYNILVNLSNSLAITLAAALVLFAIFTIIQSIALARLANTGSLKEALNIFESLKDITRIGVGKVILLFLLLAIIIGVILIILMFVFNYHAFLVSIFYIILSPYMVLFAQRALGLLYSDIV